MFEPGLGCWVVGWLPATEQPSNPSPPSRQEQIRLVRLQVGAVAGPDQPLAIRAEDGEAVETRGGGNALEVLAVLVDQPEIELVALRVDVRGEDDPLAVRREVGAEVRRAVAGDLPLVR